MTAPDLSRRSILLLPLVVAACGGEPAPASITSFEPLRYDYLTPIRLNVASIEIESRFVPGGGDLGGYDPAPPMQVLQQMGQDRLQALGAAGRAVFAIEDASIVRSQGSYVASFAVELDIYGPDNTRAGFAEARVSRTRTIDSTPISEALYDMTKTLMDAMNVEFEYQVRRALQNWLVAAPTVVPAPVEQQSLPLPSM